MGVVLARKGKLAPFVTSRPRAFYWSINQQKHSHAAAPSKLATVPGAKVVSEKNKISKTHRFSCSVLPLALLYTSSYAVFFAICSYILRQFRSVLCHFKYKSKQQPSN